MAKKRAKPPPPREDSIRIRMRTEFKEWLENAAAESRISVSSFLEIAAVHYAKKQGFTEPPPDR